MLFIDGIIGKIFFANFVSYLNTSWQYLEEIQKILGAAIKQKELPNQGELK